MKNKYIWMVLAALVLPFSSQGIDAGQCTLRNTVVDLEDFGDWGFSAVGLDALGSTTVGLQDRYLDIEPFMPFGAASKVFQDFEKDTDLGRLIDNFSKEHPDQALQIGAFFPSMWSDRGHQQPCYVLLGRPREASDAVVPGIQPIVDVVRILNAICMARDLPTKKAAIDELLALEAGPLRVQACRYFVKMQELGWNDQMQQPDTAPTQCSLAVMYRYGFADVIDLDRALGLFRLAEAQGYVSAQLNLGEMYEQGEGVVQNFAEAMRFYHLAAAQGSPDAYFNLAMMHENGDGVAKDPQAALRLFQRAADQGHVDAQHNAGMMHWEAENLQEAFRYLSLAADQGDAAAIEALRELDPTHG